MGTRTWQTKSLAGRQAHSLYFTLLPELGLVGVMIFGSMTYFNYKDTRGNKLMPLMSRRSSSRRDEADIEDTQIMRLTLYGNAILGGMIGYLVTSTFISTLYYPTFWVIMALAVALRNTTKGYMANQPEMIAAHTLPKVSSWIRHRPTR